MSHPYEIEALVDHPTHGIFRVDEEHAQFYGVYERDADDLARWLIDLPTREDAERYADWLHNARPGWLPARCDEGSDCLPSDPKGHTFPPEGAPVRLTCSYEAREVGGEDTHALPEGAVGTALGHVVEWHDVHVMFLLHGQVLDVWVDPAALAPYSLD